MITATPDMYPIRIGCDSRSAMKPSRTAQATMHTIPTSSASAADRARYRTGSPAASGATAAATMIAVADSGPTDSCREVPSRAYAIMANTATHNPVTGDTPASSE